MPGRGPATAAGAFTLPQIQSTHAGVNRSNVVDASDSKKDQVQCICLQYHPRSKLWPQAVSRYGKRRFYRPDRAMC